MTVTTLMRTAALAAVCSLSAWSASSFSVSVGFPSSPQSPGCTKNRTDGYTDVCTATLNAGTYGTALVSLYGDAANGIVVLGTLQNTKPAGSSTTVNTRFSATITDFAGQTSGHGVTVTNQNQPESEADGISVLDNTNSVVAILYAGDSVTIPYTRSSSIQLAASYSILTGTGDYVSQDRITLAAF